MGSKLEYVGAVVLSLILAGCGKVATTESPTPGLQDFKNYSVNFARAAYSGGMLSLSTDATSASAAGSFVGGGTGNKAVAGFDLFDRVPLSTLSGISFEAKQVSGSYGLYLNLIVDLDCVLNEDLTTSSTTLANIRASRKILLVNSFATSGMDGGFTQYTVNSTDSSWLAVGGAGGLPASGPGQPLTTFIASYPNACIVNAVSGDGGLAREIGTGCQTGTGLATSAPAYCGKPTSGLLVVTGDSANLLQNEWQVRKVTVIRTTGSTVLK